jgi:two-component system OmpR family sensor kinase
MQDFYRRDTAASPGGAGLGLSIARAIVVAHGGSIRIQETPGGGTTVVFRLPLGERMPGQPVEEAPGPGPEGPVEEAPGPGPEPERTVGRTAGEEPPAGQAAERGEPPVEEAPGEPA